MGHRERNTVYTEFAIDETESGRIAAMRAIHTPHLISANGELVDVRLAGLRSPTAAVIVSVLCSGNPGKTEQN
jgi:hypothetical protein